MSAISDYSDIAYSEDDEYIGTGTTGILFYSSHIPNLLLLRLMNFIKQNKTPIPKPFIERIDCTLLFVDISGFTKLSRCLNIESLRYHINAYLTKILTVVDNYGGDVCKFAGDGMYITWCVTVIDSLDSCVEKCLKCALKINRICNNYAIKVDESSMSHNEINSTASKEQSTTIYMNVHCGISLGTVAVVDVGSRGRWELLLVGQPLVDIAIADSQAKSGEIIVSRSLYDRLFLYETVPVYAKHYIFGPREQGCFCVSSSTTDISPISSFDAGEEDEEGCLDGLNHPPASVIYQKQVLVRDLFYELYISSHQEVDFEVWLGEEAQKRGKQAIMDSIKVGGMCIFR